MKKFFSAILIFIFTVSIAFSQDEELKEAFMDAEYFFLYEEYEKALPLYQKIFEKQPDNANIAYRIGMSYLHMPSEGKKDKALSIPYLEKAIKSISNSYNEGSFKEKNAPDEVFFYLGNAYRFNHQFDKSIDAYEKFISFLNVGDIFYIEYVEREIQACNNAKQLIKFPVLLETETFSEVINTEESIENCPVVSADENILIYTSGNSNNFSPDIDLGVMLHDYSMDNIFYSTKEDGQWSEPQDITKSLRANKKTVPVCLSKDGTQLYVVKDDNDDGNIYVSSLKNGSWTSAKKLNKNINSKDWESHASISADGETLYFTSDRKGGYGGLDVYKSTLDDNEEWGQAINLGPTVNTPYDEETPFILEDGKTLYFSSQGHYGMGGFDIFHTRQIGDNKWSSPLNIGYPINTVGNDLFYLPKANGEYAFFPLNNNERGIGNNDIYKIKVSSPETGIPEIELKGFVTLQDKNEFPPDFGIYVIDSLTSDTLHIIDADRESGFYNSVISSGNFQVYYHAFGYKDHVENLFIPRIYTRSEVVLNVELIPNEVIDGEYFVIKNIFFDYGKHDLRRESKIELEKLYKLMEQNPGLYVEVVGHTDSKSSAKFNLKLSETRSRSAIDYLVGRGISVDRFVAKGMGEKQHIAININVDGTDNPDGRQLNRRVEIKILNAHGVHVLVEDIHVPDYLAYKDDIKYTILLVNSIEKYDGKYFSSEYFKQKDIGGILKDVKEAQHREGYLYTIGNFSEKSEAIRTLNNAIDLGFNKSEIITNFKFEELIADYKKEVIKEIEEEENNKLEDTYTVQIKALKQEIDINTFENVSNVKLYKGKDGYNRYTVGEFKGYNKAKEEWVKIIEYGYPDAFVVNIKKYKKY